MPCFQLAQKVDHNLVALIHREEGGNLHQRFARAFANGQMLAHRKQVRKMHGNMERFFRVFANVFAEPVDLRQLHRPGNAALEVCQIDFRNRKRRFGQW
ncbi:hypothetical protein SDC9_90239 [bioreactor metagenome]|uniref:Uncharacterized protein n=1 Tax=bioreactor metagenome TaxID=1076179 RepID=A0A644ZRT3_9ZZZZ